MKAKDLKGFDLTCEDGQVVAATDSPNITLVCQFGEDAIECMKAAATFYEEVGEDFLHGENQQIRETGQTFRAIGRKLRESLDMLKTLA